MKGNEKRKGSNGRVKGERENGGSSREGREGKGMYFLYICLSWVSCTTGTCTCMCFGTSFSI